MPKIFGMVLAVMQRYLVTILRAAEDIHLARLSRTITARPARDERKWAAAGMGMLFRRTNRLAQEVNNAMISRGFDGEVRLRRASAFQLSDALTVLVVSVLIAALVFADRMI
jgi:energy-coupling factor transporter transmembrane protein EcfT